MFCSLIIYPASSTTLINEKVDICKIMNGCFPYYSLAYLHSIWHGMIPVSFRAVRIESEGGLNEESIENASIHGRQIFKDLVVDPRRSSRAFWCIGYVMSNNSNISHFSSITLFYLFCESVLKDSFISLFAFPFDFLKGTAVFKVFELYSSPTKVYASVLYINCSVYVSGCGSTSSLGIFLLFLKKKKFIYVRLLGEELDQLI